MSNRWPGGLIRKTPVTPAGPLQNGAAPGMWTLAEASYWVKQGLWPTQGNVLAVEDVFSTWLYTGNSATQTITNGIDLAGKGGLVWTKARSSGFSNGLVDTVRGALNTLISNSTDGSTPSFNTVTAFTSSGFSIGTSAITNSVGTTYVSWTFREAPNFFDVVTWTGDGTSGRTIAHNLGVSPGCVMIKRTDNTGDWTTWHRSLSGSYPSSQNYLFLNTADAQTTAAQPFTAAPSSTALTVSASVTANSNGATYVAYLFAHDTSSTGIIQCGSYTGAYPASPTVTLGWEPQWVMIKSVNNAGEYNGWGIWDNMRGMPVGGTDPLLVANRSTQEGTTYTDTGDYLSPTATGFIVDPAGNGWNINNSINNPYIYMAIRRGPMRTPTLGTSVFAPVLQAGGTTTITTNFPVDLNINGLPSAGGNPKYVVDRLRGGSINSYRLLETTSTAAEASGTGLGMAFDNNTGVSVANFWSGNSVVWWNFRRAPGFFDEVCYTGVASTNTINHNLGVAPELIIIKSRSNAQQWGVMHTFAPTTLSINSLNTDAAAFSSNYATILWATGQPTSTQFALYSGSTSVNTSGATYVAYLFASVPGVSKVGSYTGNGSSQTINCAFTTGARFVMIKRTDSTGDWYVWDSARGIVAGNDPYLALNTTAAEVTSNDSVDTDNTGFVVNQVAASNINVSAATYIFLAIA